MSTLTVTSPLEAQLAGIARQLEEVQAELARQRADRRVWSELAADVGPIASDVLADLTDRLEAADAARYLAFSRGLGHVAERVVAAFDEHDLDALGENVVTILETVREMTQPELMALLRRTAVVAREHPDEPADPPGAMALLRELRDPEVRRGLARMLTLLRAVGDDADRPETDQEVAR